MPDLPPAGPVIRRRFRRHAWEPLTMTWAEVADAVFRRNESWLRGNLPADFPFADPIYGLFHVEAVETWTRRRWGVITEATDREDAQAILRLRIAGLVPGAVDNDPKHQPRRKRRAMSGDGG